VAAIGYRGLTKVFEGGTRAVDDLDLDVHDGEFLVLVGPSGSGKTTVLRMTAGLEDLTDGEIRIGDRVVNDVSVRDRNIAMVFQNYALYPHMSVYDNMAFSLKLHGLAKESIRPRVESTAQMLGIGELLKRKPAQLSGGQRQRVAMGRAIVREPEAFLMDEPLSNLDAKLRVEMRAYVAMLHQRLRTTTLYVTHDQTEAMTMGDRVAVMRDGRLEQCDVPPVLYERPVNVFVAGFIGSPAMNLLQSRLTAEDGALSADFGETKLRLPQMLLEQRPHLRDHVGEEVILGVRPEDIEDAAFGADAHGAVIDVDVSLAEPMGAEVIVHFGIAAEPFVAASARGTSEAAEAKHVLELVGAQQEGGATIVARLNPRSKARTGEPLRVGIDVERLHFFDPGSEAAIW
jgi:multiple sugar transport system ATP-binding protein